jgi:hypothetical protein
VRALAELTQHLAVVAGQEDGRVLAPAQAVETVEQPSHDAIGRCHVVGVAHIGRVRLEEVHPEEEGLVAPGRPREGQRARAGLLARALGHAADDARRQRVQAVVVDLEALVEAVAGRQGLRRDEGARAPALRTQALGEQREAARVGPREPVEGVQAHARHRRGQTGEHRDVRRQRQGHGRARIEEAQAGACEGVHARRGAGRVG